MINIKVHINKKWKITGENMDTIERVLENELKKLTPEERETLRGDVLVTFKTLYNNITTRMDIFENKILDTSIQRNKELSIINMIVPREDFYMYEEDFSPVIEDDQNSNPIYSILQTDNKLYEKIVYVGPMESIDNYDGYEFDGVIYLEGKKFTLKLRLERDTAYSGKTEELYKTFQLNFLKWKTINAPYLNRIFKIAIIDYDEAILEEMSKIQDALKIHKLKIDDSIISSYFAEDYITIWNITHVNHFGNGVIEPTENRINYIHDINSTKNIDLYLVPEQGIHVYSIGKTSLGYRIVTNTNKNITWKFINISEVAHIRYEEKLKYPVFKNYEIPLFINKLKELNKVRIRTVAEIHRVVNSYENIKNRFELENIEVSNNNMSAVETIDLDSFIIDEFKLKKDNKFMYLYFKVLKNDSFVNEQLSFIVTIMQSLFPEYQCKGVLL